MNELLMPGDELATSEEYIPGPGTYERQGRIFSAIMGMRDFDESEKVARVRPVNPAGTLEQGNIILGEVVNVTNSLAQVSVSGLDRELNRIGYNETGVIHVSRIMEDYCGDARQEFHVGDLVRARIDQVSPSLQLATDAEELGVLKARCGRCRGMLSNRDGTLFCQACQREEKRKLAGDFHRYSPYCEEG